MDTIKKKMLSSNSDTTLGENMHIHISNIDMASEYYPVLRICLPLDRHQRTVLKKPNHSKT